MKLSLKSLSPFLLIIALFFSISTVQANPNTHLSTVVLDTNPEQTKEIVKLLLADNQITLEYDCTYSGLIVIKMKHSFSEIGDVKGYINNKLGELKFGTLIIFCDLHDVSWEGKC